MLPGTGVLSDLLTLHLRPHGQAPMSHQGMACVGVDEQEGAGGLSWEMALGCGGEGKAETVLRSCGWAVLDRRRLSTRNNYTCYEPLRGHGGEGPLKPKTLVSH